MEALCQLLRLAQLAEAPRPPRAQGRRKRRQRRRQRQLPPALPLALPAPGAPLPQRRRQRRRRNGQGPSRGLASGEVVLRRSEFLETATSAATFFLNPVNFPWLGNVAKAFERVKWLLCDVEWRPTVGTTVSGSSGIGFDWGAQSSKAVWQEDGHFGQTQRLGAVTKNDVLACTPVVEGPAWTAKRLTLPRNLLQSRLWYDIPTATTSGDTFDYGPGSVVHFSSASGGGGDIWVHYQLALHGTRKV